MPSAPSPVRLAAWLSVPLLLLAALGLWLMRAERARSEVELRRDAERWADFALEAVGAADLADSVEALTVVIPPTEVPPIGPAAQELAAARADLISSRREEAEAKLASLLARPEIDSAVSEAGLPLRPLVQRLIYEARPNADSAEALARAAVRFPSLLSLPLVEDAAASLPPENTDNWRRKAGEAWELVRTVARGGAVPGWHVVARADGANLAIPLAEVSAEVKPLVATTSTLLPAAPSSGRVVGAYGGRGFRS